MKKLVAISLVLVLVSFSAFADFGGAVIGSVTLMQGDNADGSEVTGNLNINRARIEGWGQNEEGTFGAWLRLDGVNGGGGGGAALAWWKPIDQFLMRIGGNPDNHWGKEGVTGWGFQQTPCDTDVTFGGENVWGWALQADPYSQDASGKPGFGTGMKFRDIFFEGVGNGLMFEIKPVDMVGINIALPYQNGGKVADIFRKVIFQADVNLAFGNFAISYAGADGIATNGKIFGYFGITAIENVAIDVGFSVALPGDIAWFEPMGFGVGAKVAIGDAFTLKARVGALFAGDDEAFRLLFDVHPGFAVTDSISVFADIGIAMLAFDAAPGYNGTYIAFHANPYLQVGSEWGPKFLFGFKIWTMASPVENGDTSINWAVPIALMHSF